MAFRITRPQKLLLLYLLIPVIVAVLFSVFFGNFNFSNDGPDYKPLFLCQRGPIVRTIDSRVNDRNYCAAWAKIQGIHYKCTQQGQEGRLSAEFLIDLNQVAEEKCKVFCKSISKKCRARYSRTNSCGFGVSSKRGQELGDRVGCHWGCEGTSFAYCSLYHGGYITTTKDMIKSDPPNCRCTNR